MLIKRLVKKKSCTCSGKCTDDNRFNLIDNIKIFISIQQSATHLPLHRRISNRPPSGEWSPPDMLARMGRASRPGERTIGHQDAGATS